MEPWVKDFLGGRDSVGKGLGLTKYVAWLALL